MPHLSSTSMIGTIIVAYLLFLENGYLIEASVEKAKASVQNNAILKEQSSNQISVKEDKEKAEEQVYYLPLQTIFGETHTQAGSKNVFTTSPPHISIEPAPIQTNYQESTSILYEDAPVEDYNVVLQSQCISETPVIELESRFLFPSQEPIKESVIMSGHLEIASKTSSVERASVMNNVVSKPSVALQGTEFHSHTIADL